MDIAKVFETLSEGKIISANSSQHSDIANMLLTDSFFDEVNELVNQIGYRLNKEGGYFYISKKKKLTAQEQQAFLSKNRDLIVAIAFLRHLYPRIDRGSTVSFVDTVVTYGNAKRDDSSIKDKLTYFSWIRNKDDEKGMMEQLFKHLEDRNVIEKVQNSNTDKYKVLDSINYYLSIVDSIETGEE
ncbi:hypothetical protein [Sulfurimonas sp.]|uniref:condensin complex protein MksE n=1 Tax=Sulfurimonas sp. TaxID=2022749 RepID=UPI0025DE8B29|nr:hypothetical protein [Sulfurimonas sp.]